MAAAWRPLVWLIFDKHRLKPAPLLSDNPPPLLGVRAECYETGFKVFRRPHTLSWNRKGFQALRKISITF